MSYTLSFSGNSPIIDAHIHPIIDLSERAWTKHNVDWSHTHSWVIGLSHFSAFNTVHNITEKNNKFYFTSPTDGSRVISLTPGTYTFQKLFNTLRSILNRSNLDMRGDVTTGQVYLFSKATIDFSKKDSFGALLGFNAELTGNQPHYSPKPVTITDKNYIRIICNIVDGSYTNGERAHVVHEFFTNLQPGYNIVERPRPIIYLPINATQIDRIILRLVDRNGDLIDFGPHPITIQLHLHRIPWQ